MNRNDAATLLLSGEVSIPMTPITDIDKVMGEAGFKTDAIIETNGWQVDFWKTYIHPKYGRYVLSGGLYDKTWTITTEEEEDDE